MVVHADEATVRYAVVTGANEGIGLEAVRQLAAAGVTVILTDRDDKRGTDVVASLALPNVTFHQLDVQDPSSVHSLVDFISAKFGRLDILDASGVTLVIIRLRQSSNSTLKLNPLRQSLYISDDCGEYKALAAVKSLAEIYPAVMSIPMLGQPGPNQDEHDGVLEC